MRCLWTGDYRPQSTHRLSARPFVLPDEYRQPSQHCAILHCDTRKLNVFPGHRLMGDSVYSKVRLSQSISSGFQVVLFP